MAARVAAGAGLKGCPNFGLIAQTADVHAQGAVFSNAGVDGVRATRGARVAFRSGIATGCGGFGIRAETGALIDANSAVLSACVGGGAHATALGRVELNLANCRSGAANATTDIQVSAGGQINAPSVTGGTNIAKNTVTANGVIFG